ncbi:hypothetical protein Tco_0237558 [Tanacetum coccineum]
MISSSMSLCVSPASILPLVQLLLVLIVIRSVILLPLNGRPELGAPPPPPHHLTSSSSLSSSDDSLSSLSPPSAGLSAGSSSGSSSIHPPLDGVRKCSPMIGL